MTAIRPAVKKKEVKSPICVFPPSPSSKDIDNPAAAEDGSNNQFKACKSIKAPIIPDINLAHIIFSLFICNLYQLSFGSISCQN